MILDLLNVATNVYNRALSKYLKPQDPRVYEKVEGRMEQFTPNRKYYEESPEEVEAYNRLMSGGLASLKSDPIAYANALKLAAQGGPHLHDPAPEFDDKDRSTRVPVNVSSTEMARIEYDPKYERVSYSFRQKNGGHGKIYSELMGGNQLHRWLTSTSIGDYFNRYVKN